MRTTLALLLVTLAFAPALAGPPHENEDHGPEKGHEAKHSEGHVKIDTRALDAAGVELGTVGPAVLRVTLDLPGEVALNADRVSHIVSRVPGIVREVHKNLGDRVEKGDLMAVLESRELANAKSEYLAARERANLAAVNFRREEDLWKKKISAQKDYLEAKQALAETRIQLNSAEQKLRALEFSKVAIEALPKEPAELFTRFDIRAPFSGTVIEKHISLGEVMREESQAFVLADLSTVWVNVTVYSKDLARVKAGQEAIIRAEGISHETTGVITFVGPVVGEKTRAAIARVVLPNREGDWRPGLFVTARVVQDRVQLPLAVPEEAIQQIEGKPVVFVKEEARFESRSIVLGRTDSIVREVLDGLKLGEQIVTKNSFLLKAELGKGEAGHEH